MKIHQVEAAEIIDTIREGLIVLTDEFVVEFANRSFLELFQVTRDETLGVKLDQLGNGQWAIPALQDKLEEVLSRYSPLESFEVDHVFKTVGRKIVRLNARPFEEPETFTRKLEEWLQSLPNLQAKTKSPRLNTRTA